MNRPKIASQTETSVIPAESSPAWEPTSDEIREHIHRKHGGDYSRYGWATRLRLRFNYFTPDEVYEAMISRLVQADVAWLDVGCGRDIFPNDRDLSRILADRCGILVGVDPDHTIEENPFLHQRIRSTIDDFESEMAFDLVTLRMVAEHVVSPGPTLVALARLTKPGGRVVIYTVNKWSPVSIVSRLVPFRFHHTLKHKLWRSEEKDTFPVAYQMNTSRQLQRLFEGHGFRKVSLRHLDDCRTFGNSRVFLHLELLTRTGFRALGLAYPENCLLGVYERA